MNKVVLCDTWNWNDDNDTASGIAILDTTAIPEMRIAHCNFNVVQNSPVSAVAFPLSIGCTFESVSKSKKNSQLRLEPLAFFRQCSGWSWSCHGHTRTRSGTFTYSGRCQNCFFRNLSWTFRLLVVKFELIMVITHEWQWQIICTTLNKPSNLLQLQITIIPV